MHTELRLFIFGFYRLFLVCGFLFNSLFFQQIGFIRNRLSRQWFVNADAMEAEVILYYSGGGDVLGRHYNYADNFELERILDDAGQYYTGAKPSITRFSLLLTDYMLQGCCIRA